MSLFSSFGLTKILDFIHRFLDMVEMKQVFVILSQVNENIGFHTPISWHGRDETSFCYTQSG